MTTKQFLLTLILMLSIAGAAFAEPLAADAPALTVKTFQLKHKETDKVAAMIRPLMSAEGSVAIQPGTKSLVVTDRAENLKSIADAVAKYDAPAQLLRLNVRLVAASRAEGTPRVADELKDIAAKLALLRYNAFENIGSANVEGREGENGFVDVGNGYRAEFRFGEYDPATDTLRITDFKLSRIQNDQLNQLMKTSLNLKPGQMTIMGAARDAQSARAVMIVFTARK
jgi:hypothetical protein